MASENENLRNPPAPDVTDADEVPPPRPEAPESATEPGDEVEAKPGRLAQLVARLQSRRSPHAMQSGRATAGVGYPGRNRYRVPLSILWTFHDRWRRQPQRTEEQTEPRAARTDRRRAGVRQSVRRAAIERDAATER